MTRRTFCVDVDDHGNDLDHVQLHDLHRRIADTLSDVGYVSLLDMSEMPQPDEENDDDSWGV